MCLPLNVTKAAADRCSLVQTNIQLMPVTGESALLARGSNDSIRFLSSFSLASISIHKGTPPPLWLEEMDIMAMNIHTSPSCNCQWFVETNIHILCVLGLSYMI